jgi:hypothetical protein
MTKRRRSAATFMSKPIGDRRQNRQEPDTRRLPRVSSDGRMVGMSAAAAHRLHVVVLTAEELDEQLGRGREAISFAADRGVDSPGLGRVAIVVTDDIQGEVVISHLGLVKSGGARTNLDTTWVLSAVRELGTPIRLTGLTAELGRSADVVQELASRRRGGSLPPAASRALRTAIQARIGAGEWPSDDGRPEWMLPRLADEVRQDHTNAIGTALMFSNMDLTPMRTAPMPGESPLAELRLAPSEASLIDNDLRNFPGMDAEPQREDIVRFTDREHTLDVMNVNATGIESATGVDLIYYSHDYDCFVLVQYKRMEAEGRLRIAGVDQRLPDQLKRMVAFDVFGQDSASGTDPIAYRLGPGSTFTKFAYPLVAPLREADLTRGLYVPSEYIRRLHGNGQLIGPRGGAAVTHDNLRRWLSNDQFTELVKKGWVGSSGITAQDVRDFVAANLQDGRIAVIAAHSTTPSDIDQDI